MVIKSQQQTGQQAAASLARENKSPGSFASPARKNKSLLPRQPSQVEQSHAM
jgi:hypothetical protein